MKFSSLIQTLCSVLVAGTICLDCFDVVFVVVGSNGTTNHRDDYEYGQPQMHGQSSLTQQVCVPQTVNVISDCIMLFFVLFCC